MLRSTVPLVFLLILQLSGSDGEFFFQTVKEGDDITLSCGNVQNQCQSISWSLENTELFKGGERKYGDSSSVRLLQDCSLVLFSVTKKLAEKDIICRQNGKEKTIFYLYVASLSQEKKDDIVTLTCSLNSRVCRHLVKWLNDDEEVKDHPELTTSSFNSRCSVSVSFKDQSPPSQFYQTLKCEVKQRFPDQTVTLVPQPPPGERRGETTEETPQTRHAAGLLLRHVLLPVGLLALLVSVAAVLLYGRVKGSRASERSRTNVNREASVVYENVGEPSASVRFHLEPTEN